MKKNIILFGAGGHSYSCIDVIESLNNYKIVGLVDNKKKKNTKILNYKILGGDNNIKYYKKLSKNVLISIGQILDSQKRKKMFIELKKKGFSFPKLISPLSFVSKYSKIGEGTIIMHGVKIMAGSSIGKNCIINTNSIIEHNSSVGDFCHISTGAILNGNTVVKKNTFIGSNTTIKENLVIGENCIIGMGLSIKKNVRKRSLLK